MFKFIRYVRSYDQLNINDEGCKNILHALYPIFSPSKRIKTISAQKLLDFIMQNESLRVKVKPQPLEDFSKHSLEFISHYYESFKSEKVLFNYLGEQSLKRGSLDRLDRLEECVKVLLIIDPLKLDYWFVYSLLLLQKDGFLRKHEVRIWNELDSLCSDLDLHLSEDTVEKTSSRFSSWPSGLEASEIAIDRLRASFGQLNTCGRYLEYILASAESGKFHDPKADAIVSRVKEIRIFISFRMFSLLFSAALSGPNYYYDSLAHALLPTALGTSFESEARSCQSMCSLYFSYGGGPSEGWVYPLLNGLLSVFLQDPVLSTLSTLETALKISLSENCVDMVYHFYAFCMDHLLSGETSPSIRSHIHTYLYFCVFHLAHHLSDSLYVYRKLQEYAYLFKPSESLDSPFESVPDGEESLQDSDIEIDLSEILSPDSAPMDFALIDESLNLIASAMLFCLRRDPKLSRASLRLSYLVVHFSASSSSSSSSRLCLSLLLSKPSSSSTFSSSSLRILLSRLAALSETALDSQRLAALLSVRLADLHSLRRLSRGSSPFFAAALLSLAASPLLDPLSPPLDPRDLDDLYALCAKSFSQCRVPGLLVAPFLSAQVREGSLAVEEARQRFLEADEHTTDMAAKWFEHSGVRGTRGARLRVDSVDCGAIDCRRELLSDPATMALAL